MEVKYVTLSVKRLETPKERMERENREVALRCIAGAVLALCVASISLGWYAIAANREIIRETETLTNTEIQRKSVITPTDTPTAADLYVVESENHIADDRNMVNPSPLTDEEWAVLVEVCEERRIDPALALGLIQVESCFNPNAVSSAGCYGYTQINPQYHPANLTPTENIRYGLNYLADLCEKYDSTEAGLCAYHDGHDTGQRGYANEVLAAEEEWRLER